MWHRCHGREPDDGQCERQQEVLGADESQQAEEDTGPHPCPWHARTGQPVRLTSSELALFIEGCTIVGRQALSPTELTSKDLAV